MALGSWLSTYWILSVDHSRCDALSVFEPSRGHVLTEGNTLLGDAKLEKLVILRMNRRFMEFMRMQHKHLIKDKLDQQHGKSISALMT